jgi:hypothetical protein
MLMFFLSAVLFTCCMQLGVPAWMPNVPAPECEMKAAAELQVVGCLYSMLSVSSQCCLWVIISWPRLVNEHSNVGQHAIRYMVISYSSV